MHASDELYSTVNHGINTVLIKRYNAKLTLLLTVGSWLASGLKYRIFDVVENLDIHKLFD